MNKIPPEIKDRAIFHNRLKVMKKMGIKFNILDQEENDFTIKFTYRNKKIYLNNTYYYEALDNMSASLIGNKEFTKQVLKDIQIKYPRGFTVQKYSQIAPLLKKNNLGFPLVIKPVKAGGGKGVTANITNESTLRKAFSLILKIYKEKKTKLPPIIVEEFFPGREFRLLVLNGKFIACAERVKPFIIGDGRSSVKELINKQMRMEGDDAFVFDWEVERNLKLQKVNLSTVPSKDKAIFLRENSNMSTGGISINRTSEVCAKFKKIAETCAREFDVKLCGVDMMTNDISDPQADYRIIEINFRPGFHTVHDAPGVGKSENVTEKIIKATFNIK